MGSLVGLRTLGRFDVGLRASCKREFVSLVSHGVPDEGVLGGGVEFRRRRLGKEERRRGKGGKRKRGGKSSTRSPHPLSNNWSTGLFRRSCIPIVCMIDPLTRRWKGFPFGARSPTVSVPAGLRPVSAPNAKPFPVAACGYRWRKLQGLFWFTVLPSRFRTWKCFR